jgi:hypothetical protein
MAEREFTVAEARPRFEMVPAAADRVTLRVLPPGRQALLVLVHLRRNEIFTALADAFGIGAAIAHR